MSTLREMLNSVNFDWSTGTIILQENTDGDTPGWNAPNLAYIATPNSHLLDLTHDTGYGGPDTPRFFARDSQAVYFCGQYDGSTWVERVVIDPSYYLDPKNQAPYVGG